MRACLRDDCLPASLPFLPFFHPNLPNKSRSRSRPRLLAAVYRWQNWEYVKALVGAETLVTVNATPNGRGDAILDVERCVACVHARSSIPPCLFLARD